MPEHHLLLKAGNNFQCSKGGKKKKTLTKRHKVITPEDYKAETMSVEKIVEVQVN